MEALKSNVFNRVGRIVVFWYSNIRGKKYSNIRTIRILSVHYIIFIKELIFGVWYNVVKALCMRNEDDINTAHDMKPISRAALLNDNAPE